MCLTAPPFGLMQLGLTQNNIGDTGAVELAKALAVHSALFRVCYPRHVSWLRERRRLRCRGFSTRHSCMLATTKSVIRTQSSLRMYSRPTACWRLSAARRGLDQTAFIASCHLLQLGLFKNLIYDAGAVELAKALRTNNVMKVFCAAAGSERSTMSSSRLSILRSLSSNGLDNESALEFAKALAVNCMLKRVCCSLCWSNEGHYLHRVFP